MERDYNPSEEVIAFFIKAQTDGVDCGISVDSVVREMRIGTDFSRKLYRTTKQFCRLAKENNLLGS